MLAGLTKPYLAGILNDNQSFGTVVHTRLCIVTVQQGGKSPKKLCRVYGSTLFSQDAGSTQACKLKK
jgi:hypothetical protein